MELVLQMREAEAVLFTSVSASAESVAEPDPCHRVPLPTPPPAIFEVISNDGLICLKKKKSIKTWLATAFSWQHLLVPFLQRY